METTELHLRNLSSAALEIPWLSWSPNWRQWLDADGEEREWSGGWRQRQRSAGPGPRLVLNYYYKSFDTVWCYSMSLNILIIISSILGLVPTYLSTMITFINAEWSLLLDCLIKSALALATATLYKFHVQQCQAQIEIWRSPDVHLTFIWTSPDLLTIICPSPDPYKTLT